MIRNIQIIGIPLDLGAGRRGVDMGVSALRLAGLSAELKKLGHHVRDCGDVEVPTAETLETQYQDVLEELDPSSGLEKISLQEPKRSNYVSHIAKVCKNTIQKGKLLSAEDFPLFLGGDHSLSMGSIASVAQFGRTGVIWVDAHTDINTPSTSPSGNVHGMPISHLLGEGHPLLLEALGGKAILFPEDIVYIGIRSVDTQERELCKRFGIQTFTIKDVDLEGIATITQKALSHLSHLDRIHVSFDADVLDPEIAPGVGTPVPGGLSFREAHLLMELLHDSKRVTSLDLVEVNPILDTKNQTAQLVVEMACSLLGSSIL